MQNDNNKKMIESARDYINRGWSPIPIPYRTKVPVIKGWQNLAISEVALPTYFNGKPQNIGILLGEKSGGLVDSDLDSPEAVKLADWFLPKTDAVFGRKGKPSSHRLYICEDAEYSKFNNPLMAASADKDERKNACIVEIRTTSNGKGIQTVFPPSVHESGESIEWQSEGKPAIVSAVELKRSVAKLAAASLLVNCWRLHLRHELAMAVSIGKDFLGRSTQKGKVIYLCLEEKRAEIAKHFKMMGASGRDILIHTGKTPEDIFQALKVAVADFEPVLIIIDPLSRVLRVNDFNDYASMARGLEPFIDLARAFNVHILALHHDGKGGRDGSDSILGSTAIFGAVDCHLQLKKRESGRTISSTQRYGIDLPETVIELDTETGLILAKGDLQSFILQEKKDEVLDSITEKDVLTETEIKDRVGGNSKGVISKAIRVLLDEKQLFRRGAGIKNQPYLYSKNLENLENSEVSANDNSEIEKPTINDDKNCPKVENEDSGFLGLSNSRNLENLENPEIKKAENDDRKDSRFLGLSTNGNLENPETKSLANEQGETQSTELYDCPHCPAKIPMAEDICQSCNRRTIEF